jgi:two-component system, LuxR family, sensor histidine kinase DctS
MKLNKGYVQRILPWIWLLLFFGGAAEIAVLCVSYERRVRGEREATLRLEFKKTADLLKERLEKFRFGLQGMAGIYHVEDYRPTNAQVRTYAASRDFFRNFTGSFGFGFIRVVPRGELPGYQKLRERSDPGFKVHGLRGESAPLTGSSAYVIEAIEPKEPNLPALGLDVAMEVRRKEAAEHAASTGLTTLTRRISLVQKDSAGAGFLLFHSVYRGVEPARSRDERAARLVGWVYAPILMSSLFESIAKEEEGHLELRISEGEARDGGELFRGRSWRDGGPAEYRAVVNAFERPWVLEARPAKPVLTAEEVSLLIATGLLAVILYGFLVGAAWRTVHYWSFAEKKARLLEVAQRAIFDGADFAILTTDPAGVITEMNASAVAMLGYRPEELVGQAGLSILHEDSELLDHAQTLDTEAGAALLQDFEGFLVRTKAGGVHRGNWTYVRRDGTRFPGQLNIKAISDDAGDHVGSVAIIQDLSDKKEAEAKMVHSAQLASLGEMSGGIAHEINNPLAMIKGKASVMLMQLEKGNTDPVRLKSDLEKINAVVDRIANIVSGLRAFSRDASQEGLKEADLAKVLNDTASLCQERFKAHGVELRLRSVEHLPVPCRPIQVSQALLNLLNNSHDAVANLPHPWIEVSLEEAGGVARFEVTDAGLGIPPETALKIMRPFFTTKDVGKGTGLGLSVSKGLIEAQGGKLYYDAASTHTRFVIELPTGPNSSRVKAA